MFKKILVFIALLFFANHKIISQKTEQKNIFLESKYQYGFIWQHRPSLMEVIDDNIHIFDISLAKQTSGEKSWQQLYNYPVYGFGYYFVNLGNPEELGLASAIFSYYDFPLLRKTKSALSLKLSAGLGYLNEGNIAIGSNFNLYFDASIRHKFWIGKYFKIVSGIGMTHFSNGAIDMPNLGLNLFAAKIGVQYHLKSQPIEFIKHTLPKIEKKNALSILLAAGIKEKKPIGGKKYNVRTLSITYLRRVGHRLNVTGGFDTFYDETLYDIINNSSSLNITQSDIMQYSIHSGIETILNKLIISIQLGTYIFTNYTDDGIIFQRVGLKYLITKNILANVTLKTNAGIADFIEWGLIYRFYWK